MRNVNWKMTDRLHSLIPEQSTDPERSSLHPRSLQQHHLDRLGIARCAQPGDVNPGGHLSAGCILSGPGHLVIAEYWEAVPGYRVQVSSNETFGWAPG